MNPNIYDWQKEQSIEIITFGDRAKSSSPQDSPKDLRELPEVSFGIELGGKYPGAVIDFDYGAYFRLADKIGMDREQASAQKITFSKKISSSNILNFVVAGTYSRFTKETKIKPKITGSNWILSHELMHAYDDNRGKLSHPARTLLGNMSTLVLLPISTLFFVNNLQNNNDFLSEEFYSGNISKLYFGAVLANISLYYLSPAEIRARKSSIQNREKVFSITHPDINRY
jgi:hypothetical protein